MSPRSSDANHTLTKEPDDIDPLLNSLPQPEPLLHPESTRTARLESPNSIRRLAPDDYTRLVQGIHKIVSAILPQGSVVAVISKGDFHIAATGIGPPCAGRTALL